MRILREVPHTPYRLAETEPLPDIACDDDAAEVIQRRNHLGALFTRFAELATDGKYKSVGLVPQLHFEAMVNLVASTLNFPAQEKQSLLEMDDMMERCDALIPVLQRQLETLILVRRFENLKPEDPSRN